MAGRPAKIIIRFKHQFMLLRTQMFYQRLLVCFSLPIHFKKHVTIGSLAIYCFIELNTYSLDSLNIS